MKTITRSRMCKECEKCPYKLNCNNKRMVAEMVMVTNVVQNLNVPCTSMIMPSIKIDNGISVSEIMENIINKNARRRYNAY